MAVDKAGLFWPSLTRLVVAILIVLLILAAIAIYLSIDGGDERPGSVAAPRRRFCAARSRRVAQVWPHAEQTEIDVMPLSDSVVPSWSPVKIGTGLHQPRLVC